MTTHNRGESGSSSIRRVALASAIGSTVEWYDYFIYASAAALVFGPAFFPEYDVTAGTFAAFATLALGFFVRPIGAAVFGHLGDRIGRKRVLILTLLLMGAATVGIGLLPTYAALGIAAPILLSTLRLIQGFAISGEWGGAVLMSVEHAPVGRRGFYGSWPQVGLPVGTVLANGVLILMTTTLTDEQFFAWGWRVPFLLSAVLVAIGLYIRLTVHESPSFTRMKDSGAAVRVPLLEVIRTKPWTLLLGTLALVASSAVGWIGLAFTLSYGTQQLGVDRSALLTGVLVGAALGGVALLVASAYSDRVGRRKVFVLAAVGQIVWAFPYFWLINTASVALITLALCVMQVVTFPMVGVLGSMLAEAFPAKVRYTGASLCYHTGSVLGGGIAPMVATAIIAATGSTTLISVYIVGVATVSAGAVLLLKETARGHLDGDNFEKAKPTSAPADPVAQQNQLS